MVSDFFPKCTRRQQHRRCGTLFTMRNGRLQVSRTQWICMWLSAIFHFYSRENVLPVQTCIWLSLCVHVLPHCYPVSFFECDSSPQSAEKVDVCECAHEWVCERVREWVNPNQISPYMGISILRDPLMHVRNRTWQMHVSIVPNSRTRDHMIMSHRKCAVIYPCEV